MALKSVVAGSVVVSRTFAAPVPVAPNHVGMVNDWRAVGQQMGQVPAGLVPLNESIVDMIASADLEKDLSDVVMASYSMVDPIELRSLDAHWAAILTSLGSASLVAEFLNLRSGLGNTVSMSGEADAVLWLASRSSKNGCDASCNNGWGNDSDCAPGNSLDNNNGENYEGGPDPDPDGTEGGKSNSSGNNKNP